MRKTLLALVVFLVWGALMYAVCAFISLQPNPLLWSQDGRFGFVMLVALGVMPVLPIVMREA